MMNKASLILILFCATLPYFASLGTVVRFQLKAASFFPYLAISILCLIRYNYSIKPAVFFYTLFLVGVLVFFSYNFRTGWSNYNVRKQTQHFTINDAKGHLYLEPYRVNELNALKPYLKDNDSVMVSHENVWGHVYLNNAKPVYLPFRFKEKYFHYFIEKYKINAISITYVEMKRKPFPGSFKDFLKALQSDRYSLRIVDLDEFNVYLFVKN